MAHPEFVPELELLDPHTTDLQLLLQLDALSGGLNLRPPAPDLGLQNSRLHAARRAATPACRSPTAASKLSGFLTTAGCSDGISSPATNESHSSPRRVDSR